MKFDEIVGEGRRALGLLAAFPGRWLLIVVVFFVVAESLMFIPYVGFTLKLAVAALLISQMQALFWAAEAGTPPRLRMLLGAFRLPVTSQLLLALSGVLPFFVGIAYLVLQGGSWEAAEHFLGTFGAKAPALPVFLTFKLVMYVAGIPFLFLATGIVLCGLPAWDALLRGIVVVRDNWLAGAVILAMPIALDLISSALPNVLPPVAAAVVSLVLLVLYLTWGFAFGYTLSVRAYGLRQPA